jgi:prevent-host-death family protein
VPKKGSPLVTKSLPGFIARTQFGQILERVSRNRERLLVTEKGEAKAVILGIEGFLQATTTPRRRWPRSRSRPKRAERIS